MTTNNLTKRLLFTLSAFVLLGLAVAISPLTDANAEPDQNEVGRYQLSSWASYSGSRVHHSGYYIIDTRTGKIVDSGYEIHGISGTIDK